MAGFRIPGLHIYNRDHPNNHANLPAGAGRPTFTIGGTDVYLGRRPPPAQPAPRPVRVAPPQLPNELLQQIGQELKNQGAHRTLLDMSVANRRFQVSVSHLERPVRLQLRAEHVTDQQAAQQLLMSIRTLAPSDQPEALATLFRERGAKNLVHRVDRAGVEPMLNQLGDHLASLPTDVQAQFVLEVTKRTARGGRVTTLGEGQVDFLLGIGANGKWTGIAGFPPEQRVAPLEALARLERNTIGFVPDRVIDQILALPQGVGEELKATRELVT